MIGESRFDLQADGGLLAFGGLSKTFFVVTSHGAGLHLAAEGRHRDPKGR